MIDNACRHAYKLYIRRSINEYKTNYILGSMEYYLCPAAILCLRLPLLPACRLRCVLRWARREAVALPFTISMYWSGCFAAVAVAMSTLGGAYVTCSDLLWCLSQCSFCPAAASVADITRYTFSLETLRHLCGLKMQPSRPAGCRLQGWNTWQARSNLPIALPDHGPRRTTQPYSAVCFVRLGKPQTKWLIEIY